MSAVSSATSRWRIWGSLSTCAKSLIGPAGTLAARRLAIQWSTLRVRRMSAITGTRRSRTVLAGPQGLKTLDLPVAALEELLRRSRAFSLGLLRQFALRLHES